MEILGKLLFVLFALLLWAPTGLEGAFSTLRLLSALFGARLDPADAGHAVGVLIRLSAISVLGVVWASYCWG